MGEDKPLRERTDRELMTLHCAGDPDAFAEIFRRHRDRMWALALRTTGNRETASDFTACSSGDGSSDAMSSGSSHDTG